MEDSTASSHAWKRLLTIPPLRCGLIRSLLVLGLYVGGSRWTSKAPEAQEDAGEDAETEVVRGFAFVPDHQRPVVIQPRIHPLHLVPFLVDWVELRPGAALPSFPAPLDQGDTRANAPPG